MNTFIYVSGLPLDVALEELKDFFAKCGVIRLDQNTGTWKIKIYTDDEGKPKGDARICYENYESVDMAIDLLNNTQIRPGYTVTIEQA